MKRIFLCFTCLIGILRLAADTIPELKIIPAWGLVTIPVACLREAPAHSSQLVSQALMGTPVEIIDTDGDWFDCGWVEVKLPDGYNGYINRSSIVDYDLNAWKRSDRIVVTDPAGIVLRDVEGNSVSPLPFGSVVMIADSATVILPDSRQGVLPKDDYNSVSSIENWVNRPFDADAAIAVAESWLGAPYLWGGMSSAAMDCSGLVRLAWMACGRILPRDAWQQALEGEEVSPDAIQRGDLVFFDRVGKGRVTHVAIATDSQGNMIHSSGRLRRGSLDPASPDYITGKVLTIRRAYGQPHDYLK